MRTGDRLTDSSEPALTRELQEDVENHRRL